MRVYHFLPRCWAFDDLRRRRLRISNLESLNDPFEFLGFALPDKVMRARVLNWRRQLAQRNGLLCFSRAWSSPLLWSHYGERHRGMCLGFDIPDTLVHSVRYVAARGSAKLLARIDADEAGDIAAEAMQDLLFMKFKGWEYEDEVRAFVRLDRDESGEYFQDFSDELRLRE
ncbi:MAG: hypothetical protein JWR47_1735, partial [Phenylobacterium sp.]|nr:hypothetical protein [Phenylobacterium sp.]